jgi:plastocyanin
MPITGDTVVVRMTFTPPAAYVFEPAAITVKAGDGINFLTISGQPHNVRFDPNGKAAADVRSQVNANMPEKAGDLTSIPLLEVNKPYIVSFAGVKPGTYEVDCPLHFANGMKMTVTVQ